eukprot:366537-Chlamydomonas_euryale.AAC.8
MNVICVVWPGSRVQAACMHASACVYVRAQDGMGWILSCTGRHLEIAASQLVALLGPEPDKSAQRRAVCLGLPVLWLAGLCARSRAHRSTPSLFRAGPSREPGEPAGDGVVPGDASAAGRVCALHALTPQPADLRADAGAGVTIWAAAAAVGAGARRRGVNGMCVGRAGMHVKGGRAQGTRELGNMRGSGGVRVGGAQGACV